MTESAVVRKCRAGRSFAPRQKVDLACGEVGKPPGIDGRTTCPALMPPKVGCTRRIEGERHGAISFTKI